MNIQQLSNNIDAKLNQVDQQISNLNARLDTAHDNPEQIRKDIEALQQVKGKLQKSQRIMWQAHELQGGEQARQLRQKRLIGLGLIIFSAVGLVAIAITLFAL